MTLMLPNRRVLLDAKPAWVLTGNPSLQFDLSARRAWLSGRGGYYDEASIKSLFSTFSTPAHFAIGKDGVLYAVPANALDCFYVPVGVCWGQLSEEARTNTLTYSKQFDNAAWVKGGATVPSSPVTKGPDATLSAFLLQEGNSAGEHLIYQANTAVGSNVVAVFAKYAGRYLIARVDPSAADFTVFDLQNGRVSYTKAGTAVMLPLADGWYMCALITSATGNVVWKLSATGAVTNAASGGQADYTGNGAAGVYIWQADRQAGSFVTSPIVTTSAAVTRARSSIVAADGTQLAMATQLAKAMYFESYGIAGGNGPRLFEMAGGALATFNAATVMRLTNGAANADATIGAAGTYAGLVKSAFAMDASNFTARANGGAVATQASAWSGNTGDVIFANRAAGDRALNGYLARFAVGNIKGSFDALAVAA